MTVGPKTLSAQLYRMMLYQRPLHPELLPLENRRLDRHGDYEVEMWLAAGAHVVRFAAYGDVMTEVVVESGDHLPETGLVHALPCLGEKDFELETPPGRVGFVTTIQTEQLSENLYTSTLREMVDFADETGCLSHRWEGPDGGDNLSVLDFQKYRNDFHIQSYHLLSGSGSVLRTQSIFEIVE